MSQIAIAFHRIRPPSFHPVVIVATLLKFLSLVLRLSQRCHLSRIDEVLKCGDYFINLRTLSQIPSSCLCIQLPVCATTPRFLINFVQSHVKILFYTDKIESMEWQDLVSRQRTGVCFVIHPLWSAVIKAPKFSAWGRASPVRLLQGALVILVRKHTSQLRYFGKWVKILLPVVSSWQFCCAICNREDELIMFLW